MNNETEKLFLCNEKGCTTNIHDLETCFICGSKLCKYCFEKINKINNIDAAFLYSIGQPYVICSSCVIKFKPEIEKVKDIQRSASIEINRILKNITGKCIPIQYFPIFLTRTVKKVFNQSRYKYESTIDITCNKFSAPKFYNTPEEIIEEYMAAEISLEAYESETNTVFIYNKDIQIYKTTYLDYFIISDNRIDDVERA